MNRFFRYINYTICARVFFMILINSGSECINFHHFSPLSPFYRVHIFLNNCNKFFKLLSITIIVHRYFLVFIGVWYALIKDSWYNYQYYLQFLKNEWLIMHAISYNCETRLSNILNGFTKNVVNSITNFKKNFKDYVVLIIIMYSYDNNAKNNSNDDNKDATILSHLFLMVPSPPIMAFYASLYLT